MRRHVLAGAALLPAAATLGGCYWLASYQDLTSGLGAAGSDAQADTIIVAEASTEASPGEGGELDAGLEAEAGRFCPPDAGSLVYCNDFDGVDAAAMTLGSYNADAAIVTGTFVSPPRSMWIESFGQGANGGYGVSFPLKPRTVLLQFDVSAPAPPPWVTLLAINMHDGTGTGRTLNVVISPSRNFHLQEYFSLADGGVAQNDHQDPPLDGGAKGGAWHHVVMSLTTDDGTQTYQGGLTVDGQVLEDAQPLALSWAQGNVDLSVGIQWANAGGAQLYFDNVRADFGK